MEWIPRNYFYLYISFWHLGWEFLSSFKVQVFIIFVLELCFNTELILNFLIPKYCFQIVKINVLSLINHLKYLILANIIIVLEDENNAIKVNKDVSCTLKSWDPEVCLFFHLTFKHFLTWIISHFTYIIVQWLRW